MRRRFLVLGLAAAIGIAAGSLRPAQAGMATVSTDAGSLGVFRLTNLGGGGFKVDLLSSGVLPSLDAVNGSVVYAKADFGATISFTVTSGLGGHDYTLSSTVYTKKILSPNISPTNPFAELEYVLTHGESGHFTDGLLLAGKITAVPSPLVDIGSTTYDFSKVVYIQFALTATDYSAGSSTMYDVFATPGATAMGTGVFSQAAVPEPASMALLGIGLSGLIVFHRRFARRASV